MIAFLTVIFGSTFIALTFMTYIVIAFQNGNLFEVIYSLAGGTLLVMGFVAAYTHNSDKQEIRDHVKELTKDYKQKLEDDIAFMSALYHKVHPDYRDDVYKDILLIGEKMQTLGYYPDNERIELLYKEYYLSNIDWFARNAEATYTNLN